MFEGKPSFAGAHADSVHGVYADEELLTLSWDDLVARLAAARDLRSELAHVPQTARASFDAVAAQHLAGRSRELVNSGKQAVNLVVSGNGKETGAKELESANSALPTDRGNA